MSRAGQEHEQGRSRGGGEAGQEQEELGKIRGRVEAGAGQEQKQGRSK